jgi:hypothetical protein
MVIVMYKGSLLCVLSHGPLESCVAAEDNEATDERTV